MSKMCYRSFKPFKFVENDTNWLLVAYAFSNRMALQVEMVMLVDNSKGMPPEKYVTLWILLCRFLPFSSTVKELRPPSIGWPFMANTHSLDCSRSLYFQFLLECSVLKETVL